MISDAEWQKQKHTHFTDSWWAGTLQDISCALCVLKGSSLQIPLMHKKITEEIDNYLDSYKMKKNGKNAADFIAQLALSLERSQYEPHGHFLVREQNAFSGYKKKLWNDTFSRLKIEALSQDISVDLDGTGRGDAVGTEVQAAYHAINDSYRGIVDRGLANRKLIDSIPASTKSITRSKKPIKDQVISILANVLAYWTLSDLEDLDRSNKSTSANVRSFLTTPHVGQLVCILRLLGLDKSPQPQTVISQVQQLFFPSKKSKPLLNVNNHIAQLSTGEGKSIVLGITATVLALLGYQVDCVCYSEHLSYRDFKDFESLFHRFGVSDCITYSTFNRISEAFINKLGSIRDSVASTLVTSPPQLVVRGRSDQQATRPRVILIDEVDVFFSPSFFGKPYNPKTLLKGDEVFRLTERIWEYSKLHFKVHLSKQTLFVFSTEEYEVIKAKHCCWMDIIDESLKLLLKTFQSCHSSGQLTTYQVQGDALVYEIGEEKTSNYFCGYLTLFSYFKEFERGNISCTGLRTHAYLLINSGTFSYAEMPRYYDIILGVTGTLRCLSQAEKLILRSDYNINKFTIIPSAFGQSSASFTADGAHSDVRIESDNTFSAALLREIRQRHHSITPGGKDRAVLVFFKTEERLRSFMDYSQLEANVLVPATAYEEREAKTRLAAVSGTLTFATRHFGRGEDFVCHDEDMNCSGGVHVIQAFCSETEAEEVQIRGRTARQGKSGSYSMVLLDTELEAFGIDKDILEQMRLTKEFGSKIRAMRNEKYESTYPNTTSFVKQLKPFHDKTLLMYSNFFNSNMPAFQSDLLALNHTKLGEVFSRTVCMIDATGSMSTTLTKTKTTVQAMFKLAYEVLSRHGIESCFQIQFVLFRNYSSGPLLLEASPWDSEPELLCEWLNTHAQVAGGQGNEAIEVALDHINRQDVAVTQAILIGDAPPNTDSEVISKRGSHPISYWETTPHCNEVFLADQLSKIADNNIPIHCFYVVDQPRTVTAFDAIATATGGSSGLLDIHSDAGCDQLMELLTKKVISDIGTRDANVGQSKRDEMLRDVEKMIAAGFS